MKVIPVIDLKGGVVVRARQGLRESYAPISTSLARTSGPLDVVAGLLALYPFDTIYVADLDRIESHGKRRPTLDDLQIAFPGIDFWVDEGVRDAIEARSWLDRNQNAHLVLGTESLLNSKALAELAGERRLVLSLDFGNQGFLGPEGILDRPDLWPARIIVMTLARVGSDAGPDLDRLAQVAGCAPNAGLFAAGGLRGSSDLKRLESAGVRGVLVASALHDGRLTGVDLAAARQGAPKEK
ncbi:nickel transporter [Beijerinckiaceae bacterium]|nr:nickel transporter [Beijerinckiaceae bacterium]